MKCALFEHYKTYKIAFVNWTGQQLFKCSSSSDPFALGCKIYYAVRFITPITVGVTH